MIKNGLGTARIRLLQCSLAILLFFLIMLSLCRGAYDVPAIQTLRIVFSHFFSLEETWTTTMYRVVMFSRLPRIIAAIAVGLSLSIAGSAYQGIFRNPLVSPDLLGVSSGACVGVAISILFHLGYYGNLLLSFLGGLLAVVMTVTIPRFLKNRSTATLILAGVIVSGFFSSLLGIMKYLADADTELAEITYWQLGSLAKIKIDSLYVMIPVIVVFAIVLLMLRWRINVLSLGDQEARTLGANLTRERGLVIICATILTSASICLSGTIGWIGLVVPHLARQIVGHNNRYSLPTAALVGTVFLVTIDLIARTLTGGEIPLGILTGIVGTPFFTWILIKKQSRRE